MDTKELVTVVISAAGICFAYGKNVQTLTELKDQVKELRASVANLLARTGRLEAKDEVEKEFSQGHYSGKVRRE
jgi:SpoU rRNA methylase family enzyme